MTHSWDKRNLKSQCKKSSVQSELGDDDDPFTKENIRVKQNDDFNHEPMDGKKTKNSPK